MSKLCPIKDGYYCDKQECAWWVESSRMCAVKDLAQSTKAGNERLLKLTEEAQPEYKACRCKVCTGEKCLCNKFCPEFEICDEILLGCPDRLKREGTE
jgi:hypothetical protein